jgi:hypothetical protein
MALTDTKIRKIKPQNLRPNLAIFSILVLSNFSGGRQVFFPAIITFLYIRFIKK